jgi:hypothetical protein
MTLQRNVKIAHTLLRQTPNAETVEAILVFVQAVLRNPDLIAQPVTSKNGDWRRQSRNG